MNDSEGYHQQAKKAGKKSIRSPLLTGFFFLDGVVTQTPVPVPA